MGFVATVMVVIAAVHYYLWRRLVRSTTVPGRARRVLTWVLVGLAVLVPVTLVGSRVIGVEAAGLLSWPGYLWIAVMFYLLVFSVVLEIPRAVALLVLRRRERRSAAPGEQRPVPVPACASAAARVGEAAAGAGPDAVPAAGTGLSTGAGSDAASVPEAASGAATPGDRAVLDRRLFISRTAAAVAGVGALATVGYGMGRALGDPVIERVRVRLPGLDSRLAGLRIAAVSDIHLGPLTGRGHAERIVRLVNGLEADVVAIVGDMVDGTVAELGAQAAPLRGLESRYGAYFVTGNHEYYTANGPAEWIEELRSLGVRPLQNERVEISHGGAVLDLAGVNDVNGSSVGDGPDLDRALAGRDPARPTVLLAHQPVMVTEAAEHGVDLQISGHTHGGQMAPFNLLVPLQQPVVRGLATVDGTQIYVTRGAGWWGPPVRVGAPPEITLLELSG